MSTKTIIPCLLVLLFLLAFVHSEDQETVDLIQRFVHPNITEDSPIDPIPFVPAQDRDRGFLGIRVLCKCGIQNNRTKKGRESREAEEAIVLNETTSLANTTLLEQTPSHITPYVSNGTEAEFNEYPWVVALIYNLGNGTKVHFCGGTLFSSRYILTAAHCLEGKTPETTEVWLNQHDILLQQGDTLQIKAERFIVHPKYHPYMLYNDISIIQLAEEVDIIRENYRPVCLPSLNFDPLDTAGTSKGVAAGWGQIYYSGPKSDKLLKVSVPILNNVECKEKSEPYYKRRITDYMLCAGNIVKGGPDTCPGDSGGPLFVNQDGKHVLTGIVSWGYRCGEPKKPGVYTRVSMYLGWINMEASRGGQRCAG